jgi:hypothetical protein
LSKAVQKEKTKNINIFLHTPKKKRQNLCTPTTIKLTWHSPMQSTVAFLPFSYVKIMD